MDKYQDITLQIRDAIKEDLFDSRQSFDEDKQKEVAEILKNNFSISYEELGRTLLQDISLFNVNTGTVFNMPFFCGLLFIHYGYLQITDDIYPNYDIQNRYIGYTDKGVFHRTKFFDIKSKVIHLLKRNYTIFIFMILVLLFIVSSIHQVSK